VKTFFGPSEVRVQCWIPEITASGSNVTYEPKGRFFGEVNAWVNLSFTKLADGGYWAATISFPTSKLDAERWFERAMPMHVSIFTPHLQLLWEGFVNQATVMLSSLTKTRGPLTSIGNRAYARATLSEIIGNEIITTQDWTTVSADHTDSKLKYGVWEAVINAGTVYSATEARDLRDTWLNENAFPQMTENLTVDAANAPAITLECLGYIHFFDSYVYNANTSGTDNVSVAITNSGGTGKLQQVISADPNGLFSIANSDMIDNGILEQQWEDQDMTAMTLIRSMVAKGDGSGNRCLFRVVKDRKIVYKVAPSTARYAMRLASAERQIYTLARRREEFYEVGAGEWIIFSDFLVGDVARGTLQEDPRAMFIEQLTYNSPYGLQVDGSRWGTTEQLIAQFMGRV